MAKIAFLSNYTEFLGWVVEEAKSFDFTVLLDNKKPADAYVIIATEPADVTEFLPIVAERLFAWIGYYDEQVTAANPDVLLTWDEIDDGDIVLSTANDFHKRIEADKNTPTETLTKQHTWLNAIPKIGLHHNSEDDSDETEVSLDIQEIRVIAVGGASGAGASFIAWNLAAITNLPLIEGVKTGALSIWTGDHTDAAQAVLEDMALGTILEDALPQIVVTKKVIVDCGADINHPIYQKALTRIWVTTLDPAAAAIPERARVVVNQVPAHLAFAPADVIKTPIDLVVPEGGADALLSLYTHIPWITKQSLEVQKQWRALIAPRQAGGIE